MKIAVVKISETDKDIALLLQRELDVKVISRKDVGKQWNKYNAFVFIGAMGICVRTIAPYIKDKHEDPAVVCVDSLGVNAISVLSGHVGGANRLTQDIAAILGAREIITTQSDLLGLWALDTFDQTFGWDIQLTDGHGTMNDVIATFVHKEPTALLFDIRDEGTAYLEAHLPSHVTLVGNMSDVSSEHFRLLIVVSPFSHSAPEGVQFIQYIPRVLEFGIGLAHQAPLQEVLKGLDSLYEEYGINWEAGNICTIDIKADEPVIQYLKEESYPVRFFTADELAKVDVPTPSETVAKHVGTPSVCEAAALLASNHGKMLVPKVKGKNFTLAVAINRKYLREGHIEIVGAGPGDPDLVSVRGRKMLERADLILYAGSLVPKALTECHKPGAVVRSSADMNLEEQCALMKEHYDKGHFIVRLHTGDPCIFGAIQEQMAFFDANHMDYHITPGISSFLAAAAELQSQFTIPERCQTIILTRGEGRTPMPEKEQLHLLAKSQSTMCIFLSASIVDDVQKELLMEYPEDTPVAACYHLTWPDQKIYRGQLKDLAKIVHDNHLTLTTMLVVGEAIDNREGLSELYSKHFTHLFRKGKA
ncbi:MAG: precorrin-4 C(11)-methyltransferase [Prevotella sp.]|nr:precorrin-4 C(11)-methyltransferase [Prevotella sp.]